MHWSTMKRAVTLVGVVAIAMPTLGLSQGPKVSVGPIVGYQRTVDLDDGRLMAGGALRLRLLPMLGAEGSINYRSDQFNDGGPTVRSWPIMVTGLIYPLPFVYGAVGFGWHNTTFDFESPVPNETTREVGWHFGGGLALPLGAASLIGDLRYVFLDYDFQEVPGVGSTDADFYVISAGLLFRL